VGAFGPPLELTQALHLPGAANRLKLLGAVASARYVEPRGQDVAIASHTLGSGRSLTLGFDVSRATPEEPRGELFQQALRWVTPPPAASAPLGVAAVEVVLENEQRPVQLQVSEVLEAPLRALSAEPAAAFDVTGQRLEWRVPLARDEKVLLRYLARLPDQVGRYGTQTEVVSLRASGPRLLGTFEAFLEVHQTGAELLASARTAASLLPGSGHDGAVRQRIERALASVQSRPVNGVEEVEANLEDLFGAVEEVRSLKQASPLQVRLALDSLIRYWEARWYALS
jgi:hypothetical protein